MKIHKMKITIAFLIIELLAIGSFAQVFAQKEAIDTLRITTDFACKQSIAANQKHLYRIDLKQDEAIKASIDQLSVDVVVDIYNSNSQLLSSIDGSGKIEKIDFTARQTGTFFLELYPYEKERESGEYSFVLEQKFNAQENIRRIAKKEIPSQLLFNLWLDAQSNPNAVSDFLNKQAHRHVIESIEGNPVASRVTYFYIPSKNTEYMMQSGGPDYMGLRFSQLGNTALFFASHVVPNDAIFNYGFNEFKKYSYGAEDVFVSRTIEHVYDNSVIMPGAMIDPYAIKNPTVKKGSIREFSLYSTFLNEERKVTVLLPENYNAHRAHKLLILFDGEEYGGNLERRAAVPTSIILDNLHAAEKIEPTITLLVWHMGKRNKDLVRKTFGNFIAQELIPWTRKNYAIGTTPADICVGGSSRGGYAASFIAFNHSNSIGNVLSQSGSYWITSNEKKNHWMYPTEQGKLITAFKKSKKLPIRFYMNIGLYDAGASMLGMNREFRSILQAKGYNLTYEEFKGGHSYLNWKQTLSAGILAIFGK